MIFAMNTNHLSQIFTNYIEKFEFINNTEHHENYKWLAAKKFRKLMDAALAAGHYEPDDNYIFKATQKTAESIL